MNNNTNTIVVLTPSQIAFLRELIADGIAGCEISRDNMRPTMIRLGLGWPPAWIVKDQDRRVSRGLYRVDELDDVRELIKQETADAVAPAEAEPTGEPGDSAPRTDFDRAMQTEDPPKYGYTMQDADGNEFKCDQQGNPAPAELV
jgi:hypothetical protein